ncbi:hypothetical protein CBA19CS22_05840 [Caballeronia novacaledonica]|uniref:Uncharacterized protein n=1 Tax=Caballeronia novacaledonica TaxID=1544861 RepID=A0ACB5QMC1_9BURK|nr:hypothetical protein CBA19CS22_05840 [Caballeronia novacaledonica]
MNFLEGSRKRPAKQSVLAGTWSCFSTLIAESTVATITRRSCVADDKLDDLAITDPYKAVAIDVAALEADPNLPGGITVTGLVYDVKTCLIKTVVPATVLRHELDQVRST